MAEDCGTDERLLRDLMDLHGRTVRVVVSRHEHDRAEAEEVWDDVFQLAYERIDDLAPLAEAQQRSWLIRTAQYLVINRGRRSATRRRALDRLLREPVTLAPSPEEELVATVDDEEARQRADLVRDTLRRLPFEHRQVLILHALGNRGPAIAQQLGISHEAARKRLMVARIAFRQVHPAPVQPPPASSER